MCFGWVAGAVAGVFPDQVPKQLSLDMLLSCQQPSQPAVIGEEAIQKREMPWVGIA
jgi:hypothetical protein